MKAIVLCEGSDFDRLILADGAPSASDIGEAVLRNPKVDVNHRDIYLRRGLCGMVSIFLRVMSTDFAGSTSYGIRQRDRRRVVSFLRRHIRTRVVDRLPLGFAPADPASTIIRRCDAGSTRPCNFLPGVSQGEP